MVKTSLLYLLLVTSLVSTSFAQNENPHAGRKRPTGKGYPETEPSTTANSVVATGQGIDYHGGPIMYGGITLYYIWYGDWKGNSAISILEYMARHLGGTHYFNINTTYRDSAGHRVSNVVNWGGSTTDSYSMGTTLTDLEVQNVVSSAIKSGRLPKDTKGVYVVLASKDVKESSGFCTKYCGWHSHGTVASSDIKYAFIGNPAQCPSACEFQRKGPNWNSAADAMASIIAHEVEEAATDPHLNAWYDEDGNENADKCAWTYGSTYTTASGAKANMKLGTKDYLIQQNWLNANGGKCTKYY
jgi:hypothetical protein